MEKFKNVAPVEDFNWDAYENGAAETNLSKEELEKAYDGTLNNVNNNEVVDGKIEFKYTTSNNLTIRLDYKQYKIIET